MANYSTDSFLDQFKDQLTAEQQKPPVPSKQGEVQGQWSQEDLQQYYQYNYGGTGGGYDYSQQYGNSFQSEQPSQPITGPPQPPPGFDYSAFASGNFVDPYAAAAFYGYNPYSGFPSSSSNQDSNTQGPGQEPSRSIWLGNIHPDTTEGELQASFGPFGMIEHIKILPAKNCAFVRFIELDAAIRAHSVMGQAYIRGQQIKIGWGKAEPVQKEETGPPPCRNLWLGNINPEITEDHIRSTFAQFGTIEKVRIIPAKNCAFVNFTTLEAAMTAKAQLSGATLIDRPLKINYGKETGKEGGIGDLTKPLEPPKPKVPAPPPEGPPPDDPLEKSIIDKLAGYVAKNGLQFEFITQDKQKDNPKFKFIEEGHPYNAYYRYSIWKFRYPNAKPEDYEPEPPKPAPYGAVPPPPTLTAPRPPPSDDNPPIPPGMEYLQDLASLLDYLTPTKDSIKETKTWIMENKSQASEIAGFIHAKLQRIKNFDKKLNIIHLMHDVLHHSARERAEGQTIDLMASAFLPYIEDILKMSSVGEHPDNQEKLLKVVRIWDDRHIFDSSLIQQWTAAMEIQERREEEPRRDRESSRHRSRDKDDRDDRDRKRRDRDRDYRDRDRDRDRDRERDSKHRRH